MKRDQSRVIPLFSLFGLFFSIFASHVNGVYNISTFLNVHGTYVCAFVTTVLKHDYYNYHQKGLLIPIYTTIPLPPLNKKQLTPHF